MYPHHLQTIERLKARFEPDPQFQALILGGSIAKGWANEDSDVDFVLVAADEAYQSRAAANQLHYFDTEIAAYPGGYVDGKIVDLGFLQEVAQKGSEPARSAFWQNQIIYTKFNGLDDLLKQIVTYDEAGHTEKLASFYAQVQALQWYIGEAEKRADLYLLTHSAAELVLYGGRMILAHNRVLYPYRKWFRKTLSECPAKPQEMDGLIDTLLAKPTKNAADRFCEAVLTFTNWPQPKEGWPARFMRDTEWTWRNGWTPLMDC